MLTVLLGGCDTASPEKSVSLNSDKDFAQAAQTFREPGQCGKQWDVLWPLAKNGDGRALAQLASDLFIGDLEPPGKDQGINRGARKRAHAFALGVYAASARIHPSSENLRFMVQDQISSEKIIALQTRGGKLVYSAVVLSVADKKRLLSCDGSEVDGDACLTAVRNANLLPPFDTYSKAIDKELKSSRNNCFRSYL